MIQLTDDSINDSIICQFTFGVNLHRFGYCHCWITSCKLDPFFAFQPSVTTGSGAGTVGNASVQQSRATVSHESPVASAVSGTPSVVSPQWVQPNAYASPATQASYSFG